VIPLRGRLAIRAVLLEAALRWSADTNQDLHRCRCSDRYFAKVAFVVSWGFQSKQAWFAPPACMYVSWYRTTRGRHWPQHFLYFFAAAGAALVPADLRRSAVGFGDL